MPIDVIHAVGSTVYFVFFLLFLWARRVPRTNPGAGWWVVAMGVAFASRLVLAVSPSASGTGLDSSLYSALNVVEKFCLVAGLVRFFEAGLPLRGLYAAAVAVEAWILLCMLLDAPAPVRGVGVALFNAGCLGCAAWIAYGRRDQIDRRLMLAVAAISGLLALHWASAFAIIELAPSWRGNGFLFGTGLVLAQYFCLLAIVLASFQQRLLEAESKALDMAFQDPLTGLSNQRYMSALFENALMLAMRPHQLLAVVYIDIDDFKPINDGAGHRAGDEVLKAMAARLKGSTRSTDICARVGGDEFVAICTQLEREEHAHDIARKLLHAFAQPVQVAEREYTLGASIGISLYPLHGHSLPDLVECADRAMYRAKSRGKGSYHVHAAAPEEAERLAEA